MTLARSSDSTTSASRLGASTSIPTSPTSTPLVSVRTVSLTSPCAGTAMAAPQISWRPKERCRSSKWCRLGCKSRTRSQQRTTSESSTATSNHRTSWCRIGGPSRCQTSGSRYSNTNQQTPSPRRSRTTTRHLRSWRPKSSGPRLTNTRSPPLSTPSSSDRFLSRSAHPHNRSERSQRATRTSLIRDSQRSRQCSHAQWRRIRTNASSR